MKNKFEIRGDKVVIFLLRKDKSVIETTIDLADFEKANSFRNVWYAEWCEETKSFYARGNQQMDGKYRTYKLHRVIMDCPKGLQVDHINHDTLNNERSNLRVVTHAENGRNLRGAKSNSSTGIRNVHWNKRAKKYSVVLIHNKKCYYFGYFTDINLAADRAEEARKKVFGEFHNSKVI